MASKRAPRSAVMVVGAGAAEVVDTISNIIRRLNRRSTH